MSTVVAQTIETGNGQNIVSSLGSYPVLVDDDPEPLGLVYHLPTPLLDAEVSHKERVIFPLLMINGVANIEFINPYTLVIARAFAVDWEIIKPRVDEILVKFVFDEKEAAMRAKKEPRGILTEDILTEAKNKQRMVQFGDQGMPGPTGPQRVN